RPPTFTRLIEDTALLGERLVVTLLGMDLRADVLPLPARGEVMSHQQPHFDLLPRVLGQQYTAVTELGFRQRFESVERGPAVFVAIAVDAEQKKVHIVAMAVQRLLDPLPLQCLADSMEPWILADADLGLSSTGRLHHRLDNRLEQMFVLHE